ncbi:DMT family transporter [Guggenheimella bovis]
MAKKLSALFFALLASLLYALSIPGSKILLKEVSGKTLAGLLYLGAGVGIGILFLLTKPKSEEPFQKEDVKYLVGMVLLDILAPIFMMTGLLLTPASSASLLNNFEIVATTLIALVVFKEKIHRRLWAGIFFITLSSILLSLEGTSFHFSIGSLFILLATLSWGLENNCTRMISGKSTYLIVIIKGFFSGIGALIVAFIFKESFPELRYMLLTMLLGFLAYGLSIFFYIKAQATLGASKTSAYYAVAPFLGAFLSFVILREPLPVHYLSALSLMLVGTVFVIRDTLLYEHKHVHTHTISHTHDGVVHTHTFTHTHEHTHGLKETHDHTHILQEFPEHCH